MKIQINQCNKKCKHNKSGYRITLCSNSLKITLEDGSEIADSVFERAQHGSSCPSTEPCFTAYWPSAFFGSSVLYSTADYTLNALWFFMSSTVKESVTVYGGSTPASLSPVNKYGVQLLWALILPNGFGSWYATQGAKSALWDDASKYLTYWYLSL